MVCGTSCTNMMDHWSANFHYSINERCIKTCVWARSILCTSKHFFRVPTVILKRSKKCVGLKSCTPRGDNFHPVRSRSIRRSKTAGEPRRKPDKNDTLLTSWPPARDHVDMVLYHMDDECTWCVLTNGSSAWIAKEACGWFYAWPWLRGHGDGWDVSPNRS